MRPLRYSSNVTWDGAPVSGMPVGRPLLAVLPTAGMAIACAVPLIRPDAHLLWLDRRLLAMMIEMEWLVLAMGMFFVFPMLMPGHTRGANAIRWGFFGLILWGAGVYAKDIGHWTGVAHYLGLVWVTYASTMLAGADFERRSGMVFAAVGRWIVQLAAFAVLYVSLDLGSFRHSNDSVLAAGVIYFSLLIGLDLVWFRWIVPRWGAA
jgi:hypothetical protein